MMNLKPGPPENGYDAAQYLSIRGLGRLAEGQLVKLNLGETIVLGRSRHCDWSLRRAPSYLMCDARGRAGIKQDLAFNSVSRRHARLSYVSPDTVEVENLSGNGTLVDGHLVDRIVLTDVRTKTHRIQLGPKGVVLELEPGSLPV
jgi:pSer/pThr/pTyr-binding forkhead associated (FHA) protein